MGPHVMNWCRKLCTKLNAVLIITVGAVRVHLHAHVACDYPLSAIGNASIFGLFGSDQRKIET